MVGGLGAWSQAWTYRRKDSADTWLIVISAMGAYRQKRIVMF
jgi:hypothetical protein